MLETQKDNLEIEEKFLINKKYKEALLLQLEEEDTRYEIKQGYLIKTKDNESRVRIVDDGIDKTAYFTYKASTKDKNTRKEIEFSIPVEKAEELYKEAISTIEKTRYLIGRFEVDIYKNGLMVAEIELKNKAEDFFKPLWLGKCVTGKKEYSNAYLSENLDKVDNKEVDNTIKM